MLRQPGCAGRWPALHGEQVKPGNVHQRRAQADGGHWPALHGEQVKPGNVHQRRAQADGGRWPALHGEQVKPGNVHQRRAQADGGRWPALHGEQVKPSGWCITHHCPLVPPFRRLRLNSVPTLTLFSCRLLHSWRGE